MSLGLGGDGEALRGEQAGEGSQKGSARWRLVLVWFLRLLSVFWLAKGLLAWTVIFGVSADAQPAFENRLLSFQAIIVYFAVIDLVAAVGLWLTSTWGGVLWLLASLSQLLLSFFFPRFVPLTGWMVGIYVALMAAYFLVTWAAENEAE
ncbi:MAG: hypothetical protein J0I54_07320 [Bosea sp.]|uniref:DUF6163 family protein n=1 Tax=unclassified Bosea (in: a-proteobacteria) TaxID=2653178 RepID=UPI000A6EAD67|nr:MULTISPECIES: DUF6163 family protein [unclassified Bosea (in: a-proteobacteria)]MBN9456420.1 hypothetical protein [Bosea sp. (in: a-proteobacteria)]